MFQQTYINCFDSLNKWMAKDQNDHQIKNAFLILNHNITLFSDEIKPYFTNANYTGKRLVKYDPCEYDCEHIKQYCFYINYFADQI